MSDISLRRAVVVMDRDQPSFVQHAVGELRREIDTLAGVTPPLHYEAGDVANAESVIAIGRPAAEAMLGRSPFDNHGPGPGGFILRSVSLPGGRTVIVAAGGDAQGTNYAVMELYRRLVEAAASTLPALDVRESPRFPVRGLYLHQHWRYRHPYATWSWSADDWRRAVDILAHLRFNLLLIWPHMDMIAPPLDAAERDHLADLRSVIDYAQRKCGIRVWLVEPANVLLDQPEMKRLPMEQRDYYAYAHMTGGGLKNPAEPNARTALRANREALYRHVPNADGYGFIDSDPGGWLGSPASEFVDLLAEQRTLLDQFHERAHEVTVFHWALAGWGNGTAQDAWRDTMGGFVKRVPGPRGFLAFFANHVEIARELNHLPQTILFPYGIIDGEPSFPLTELRFDQLKAAFDFCDRYPGIGGVIGNVQTFLIQLPNIYCTARLGWDVQAADDPAALLRSLAALLFPDQAGLLADAWVRLHQPGSREAAAAADRLDEVAQASRRRPGAVGRLVFPRADILFTDLATILRIHAAAEVVREQAGDSGGDVVGAATQYLRTMLDWQRRNGFFGTYAAGKQVIYDTYIYSGDAGTVRAALDVAVDAPARPQVVDRVVAQLVSEGYDADIARSMTGQLFGTSQVKMGSIEKELFSRMPPASETMPWTQVRKT